MRARPSAPSCEAAFEAFDVLLTPTMPVTATPIGDETVDINGQPHPLAVELSRFTYPFNLSRLPALSVPCGFRSPGPPDRTPGCRTAVAGSAPLPRRQRVSAGN